MEGRKDVEDDPGTGSPSTSKTNANNKKVLQLVYSDRWLTLCIIADKIEIA